MEPWLEELIGVPYVDFGNSPSEGFHCTGLVRFILKTRFDADLPDDPIKWRESFIDLGWPTQLRDYDMPALRNEDNEPHVGLVFGDSMLHAWRPAGGVVLQRIESIESRIDTVFRLKIR